MPSLHNFLFTGIESHSILFFCRKHSTLSKVFSNHLKTWALLEQTPSNKEQPCSLTNILREDRDGHFRWQNGWTSNYSQHLLPGDKELHALAAPSASPWAPGHKDPILAHTMHTWLLQHLWLTAFLQGPANNVCFTILNIGQAETRDPTLTPSLRSVYIFKCTYFDISQNHRIVGVEGTSGNHPVQLAIIAVPYNRLHRKASRWVFNISREDSTISLGTMCQCSVPLTIQNFFLVFRWNLLCSSLWLLPLALSLGSTERARPHPLHSHTLFIYKRW